MSMVVDGVIAVSVQEFRKNKRLAEKAMAQLTDEQLFWSPDPLSNSIAVLIQHISGNQVSRWTDFLTTDGEKPDRHRDEEFVERSTTRAELMQRWERGWSCLFSALAALTDEDLPRVVHIRAEPLSVTQAIQRQLVHYAQHVGQIVYLAKHMKSSEWSTLSVPRGESGRYLPK